MKNKDIKIDETMLYRLFIFVDYACLELENYVQTHLIADAGRPRRSLKRPH